MLLEEVVPTYQDTFCKLLEEDVYNVSGTSGRLLDRRCLQRIRNVLQAT